MCLQYTRSKLWAIGASLERKQQSLPLKTLHILRSENICATPKTKRGTVGGVNHFRIIPALLVLDLAYRPVCKKVLAKFLTWNKSMGP